MTFRGRIPAWPAIAVASACALPRSAAAHSPLPGLDGFYAGLWHPFTTPDQVLLMAATGMLLGSLALSATRRGFLAFLLGMLGGIFIGTLQATAPVSALLGLAGVGATWAALLPGRSLRATAVFTLFAGCAIGLASVPEGGPPVDRLVTTSG